MADTKSESKSNTVIKYVVFVFLFTVLIGVFSLIMAGIASYRNDVVNYNNYVNTSVVYNGPLEQEAPSLRGLDMTSDFYKSNNLTPQIAKKYIDNTFLTSTIGNVVISAEFVKKGLALQPTYRTSFSGDYILKNELDEKSVISFIFPFPVNSADSEISNAVLIVNGEEVKDAKTKVDLSDQYGYQNKADGLKWEGEVPAEGEVKVKVSYDTVGLSLFTYRGIENFKGSQDFDFTVRINGTRSYNVVNGLSVDKRTFGDNFVELKWNKKSLFSSPLVSVSVGEKLNPSTQVSRIYLTMSPLYAVFMAIFIFLAYKFAKPLRIFDLFLITVLFTVFFPFVHYLSSFTVDPTMELFSSIQNVTEFSMPLYAAFAIAWVLIGGLMYYLIGRMESFRFSTKFLIPTLVLFLGFFPLVVTIPEYSMLLVIIGFIALIAILVQVRIKLAK